MRVKSPTEVTFPVVAITPRCRVYPVSGLIASTATALSWMLQVRCLLLVLLSAPHSFGAELLACVSFWHPYAETSESCPPNNRRCLIIADF